MYRSLALCLSRDSLATLPEREVLNSLVIKLELRKLRVWVWFQTDKALTHFPRFLYGANGRRRAASKVRMCYYSPHGVGIAQ